MDGRVLTAKVGDTVILHHPTKELNGSKSFPAIVMQGFKDSKYRNLKVFGWGEIWDEGSVCHRDEMPEGVTSARYYTWPDEEI